MNTNNRITKRINGKATVKPDLYPRAECGTFPCGRVGECKFSTPRYRRKCPFYITIDRLADLEDKIERGELVERNNDGTN